MRYAAVLMCLVTLSACPRRHDPPRWEPSFHEPVRETIPDPAVAPSSGAPRFVASRPAPAAPVLTAPPQPPAGALVEVRTQLDGGTVNGHLRGPRAEELEAVVRGATPALQRCVDAGPLPSGVDIPVRVAYRILPLGRTGTVDVEGTLPPDVVACLKAVFDGLRFPIFEGEPISAVLPFQFRRETIPGQQAP